MSLKAQKTKADLLKAARAVLLSGGIARLSMDRVAEQAGVSKGAIMYHFPTKRALQAALIEDYAEHLDRELRRHEATAMTAKIFLFLLMKGIGRNMES